MPDARAIAVSVAGAVGAAACATWVVVCATGGGRHIDSHQRGAAARVYDALDEVLALPLELIIAIVGNSAATDLLAKPLNPPRLYSFAIGGFRNWHGVPEGSLQLRGLLGKSWWFSLMWGAGPVIRLRGIHVRADSALAKSFTVATPCMLEWMQLGLVEICLPSLLSPGLRLTVKNVYLRLRSYDYIDAETEAERMATVWAQAIATKQWMVAAADGVMHAEKAAEPAAASSMDGGVVSRVVDATDLQVLNMEVVICGGKHPSLASLSHRRDADAAEESEARVHLKDLSWCRAAPTDHGGLLASMHELKCETDVRIDGHLIFRSDFSLLADIEMPTDFALNAIDLSMPEGITMTVWPRQVAPLNQFMGWLSHAGCVMKYASQRCGPKQPLRPRALQDQIVQQAEDGVVVFETRHRPEGSAAGGEEEHLSAKELHFAELDDHQIDAAQRLGCGTAAAWDDGIAVVWLKQWPELSATEMKAAQELGLDEWNWEDDDDNDDNSTAAASRQSLTCFAVPDADTRMAILQSMDLELKRINARRLWNFAFRCIRLEFAQRAVQNLFRLRVKKGRAEWKYIELWQQSRVLEQAVAVQDVTIAELKAVRDQITELEDASLSMHTFSGDGAPLFWEEKSPLLDYAEIIHCRKMSVADGDTKRIPFDATPPIYPTYKNMGSRLSATLREFRLVVASGDAGPSEVNAISFTMAGVEFVQTAKEKVSDMKLRIDGMSLGVEKGPSGGWFDFVTSSSPERESAEEILQADIVFEPLLMKVTAHIGCLTCFSDLRPLNFINCQMAAPGRPLALYAPLLPAISAANDAAKFEDDVTDLQSTKWTDAFNRLSDGESDEGATFTGDRAAEMACKFIIETVGGSAQATCDEIVKTSGHSVDWDHVEQFAERVGYMRHDHLQTEFERIVKGGELKTPRGDEHRITWPHFCTIMTSMEKAHRAELMATDHPRMALNVVIDSPRIVLRVDPEADDGIALVMEPGNLCLGSFFEGEMVITDVDREVRQHGSDQENEFINLFQADVATALGIPITDVCLITVCDASVPAPDGDQHAELRHLLRAHRDDFAQILQSFEGNTDVVHVGQDEFAAALASRLQTLAWDLDEDTYVQYCKVVLNYLDTDHDGQVSLCEMKDDLSSNRAVHDRTDVRVKFSLRPRTSSAEACATTLSAQAADPASVLRSGAVTNSVERFDVDVNDGIDSSRSQLDEHFFDNLHYSWTDFQLSLEKPSGESIIRDILISKFDLNAYIATCILPDFLLVGQPHLARTKARIEMSSMNVQASMQDIYDISTLTAGILETMDAAQAPPADAATSVATAPPVPLPVHNFRELDVHFSCGPWTVRLNHATKRPIVDFRTKLNVDNLTQQNGTLRCDLGLKLSAQYDNLHVGHWEPLLEPWHLSVAFSQSVRSTKIVMRSEEVMNLNVSHSLMQNVMGSMNTAQDKSEALQTHTPFQIKNLSGADVRVRLGWRDWTDPSVHFYQDSRDIMNDSTADVELEEMCSATMHETLPERVLRVEFPGSPWKTLALSNLNRAGVTKVLLHKDFGDSEEEAAMRKHPRRQPSHHDKDLIVAAARSAQRSTVVHVDNQTEFKLVRDDDEVENQGWNMHAEPPRSIAPNETVVFSSVSNVIRGAIDSEVMYHCMTEDSMENLSAVKLHSANPLIGDATAGTKQGRETGPRLEVEVIGPTNGPHNEVTFVVRGAASGEHKDLTRPKADSDPDDPHVLVCAVDISDTFIKSIVLCTTICFENDTAEDLDIDFGSLSATGVFTSIGSELVQAGQTEFMSIGVCSAKYARLRPALGGGAVESSFHWCEEFFQLDSLDSQLRTVTCRGTEGVFHCSVTPVTPDPLDARQRWRVAPVRTLVNLLPCAITAHLFSSESEDCKEMSFGEPTEGGEGLFIAPGARVELPTTWPYPGTIEEAERPKSAWLSVSRLGEAQNVAPEATRRVCVYVNPAHKDQHVDFPDVSKSFLVELESSGSVERKGHASIAYEGTEIVLFVSHWIVNKTSNSFTARGTGEHDAGPITIEPRSQQSSEVADFGSVFNLFGVGDAASMHFQLNGDGAEEQHCEIDLAQKVEPFEMKVNDDLTRCSVRVGLAESEFWRTKIIEINPLWVVVNQTTWPVTVVEHADRQQQVALAVTDRSPRVPFTLGVGESAEVLAAPRCAKAAYALQFALGRDIPLVEETVVIKVWEHERRIITKGWSADHLGDYSMSPLIPVPVAGGDPAHLVVENLGGKGQPITESKDVQVRQVSLHLAQTVRKEGDAWTWIDTWQVSKDIEHGSTDSKGWEYCDAAAIGMKDVSSPQMTRHEQWQGEINASSFFRRRCWTRTQRQYLSNEAKEAAAVGSQLGDANLGQLKQLCGQLKIWDRMPVAARGKPAMLRPRLRNRVEQLTTNMWSPASTLPLSGDMQLNIPTLRKQRQRSAHETVNINVTTTAQGTFLAVLTDAKQPHYSLDNRSGIPLQSRIVTRRSKDVWFDVPVSKVGECTDVWEGESGAALQLKVHGSEDEGPVAMMSELGELAPWEVVYMTPHGPTTVVLVPYVAIQREAKTLIVRRAAVKAQGGHSAEIVGQFALDIALAGFGLSVVNREPKELLYISLTNVRMSQTPTTTLKVTASRLNNVMPSTVFRRTPKLILRLGNQQHETAAVENAGGFVTYKGAAAEFKTGALNILEIVCVDPANQVVTAPGRPPEDEVLGVMRINIDLLNLDEQPYVEDWFDLPHTDAGNAAAAEGVADLHALLDDLAVYLKLEVSATMDTPECLEFGLGSFQVDMQDERCEDPAVIAPEASTSHRELVTLHVVRCTSLDGLTSQLDDVELNVQPMKMCITWQFLAAPLMEFAGTLPWGGGGESFDGEAELRRQFGLNSRFDELAALSIAKPTKIYAKRIALSSIKLTATTKMNELIRELESGVQTGGLLGMLFRWIASLGVMLTEITDAPIELNSLELPLRGSDPFTTQQALIYSIMGHVFHEAVSIGLRVLGSTATFKGPIKLVGSLYSGLEELGTGFVGLKDGDAAGVALGVLGLGKNVAGGGLTAVSWGLGLVGGVMDSNVLTRNTVGALIGVAQKGLSEVTDAIDGSMLSTRTRKTRGFGLDDELQIYSSSVTLGTTLLRMLQQSGQIPAFVEECQCFASVFLNNIEHDRSFVTLVTGAHVLQLVGPTNGYRRPTHEVLSTLRLVRGGSTSLSNINRVRLESGALSLRRTHGSNFVRNEMTDVLEERRFNVDATIKGDIKVYAANAKMLDGCFLTLTKILKSQHQPSTYTELRAPVLTVSVLAADDLPKGRHAPKVAFVLQVPGARVERYVSAGNDDDIAPTFDEAAHFVIKDYHSLASGVVDGAGVTLEVWDRNRLTSDELVGTAKLAGGSTEANALPTADELSMGETWSTDGPATFDLKKARKSVGTVQLAMRLAPQIWSWEHRLSFKEAGQVVLSEVAMKDEPMSPGTPTRQQPDLSPQDPLVTPPQLASPLLNDASTCTVSALHFEPGEASSPARGPSPRSSPVPGASSPGVRTGAKVHLRMISATNIPELEISTITRPYVQLQFRDERTQRTAPVRSDDRNPAWLESESEAHDFLVPVSAGRSRVFGSVWNRAAIPPDDLIGTFELPVSYIQQEATVINLRLTPGENTVPLAPGEVPTVMIMCVRTQHSVHAPMGIMSPIPTRPDTESELDTDEDGSSPPSSHRLSLPTPLLANSFWRKSAPNYAQISVFPLPPEIDGNGKVRYRFDLSLGDDKETREVLQNLSTRYSTGLKAHERLMETSAAVDHVLEYPPKNWLHNMDDRTHRDKRQASMLAYYRRLVSKPELYASVPLLEALGLVTREQQARFLERLAWKDREG